MEEWCNGVGYCFRIFLEEEVDKNVLKLDSGDGCCSVLNLQKISKSYTSKSVNFRVIELYFNTALKKINAITS